MSTDPAPRNTPDIPDTPVPVADEAAECFVPTLDGLITSVIRGEEPMPVIRDRAAGRCASIAHHEATRRATTGTPVDDTAAQDPVLVAADLLFEVRHELPPDVMRTLADVWTCASAARYGEPHERFWEPDEELGDPFSDHDTAECAGESADDYDASAQPGAAGQPPANDTADPNRSAP